MIAVVMGVDQDLKGFSRVFLQGIDQVAGLFGKFGIHHCNTFSGNIKGDCAALLGEDADIVPEKPYPVRIVLQKICHPAFTQQGDGSECQAGVFYKRAAVHGSKFLLS
jgi:hypothetical protein